VGPKWRKWVSPIVLLIVLGVLAYAAWWGYKALTNPLSTKDPAACVSQSVSGAVTTDMVTVRVYNAGTDKGLAAKVSAQLVDKGFKIGFTGNTQEKVDKTTVIGGTPTDPAVRLVAGFFAQAAVQGDNRTDGTVDVLLPTGAAGVIPDAPTSIDAPGAVVCVTNSAPTPQQLTKTPPA
jgi:hypothetical protein